MAEDKLRVDDRPGSSGMDGPSVTEVEHSDVELAKQCYGEAVQSDKLDRILEPLISQVGGGTPCLDFPNSISISLESQSGTTNSLIPPRDSLVPPRDRLYSEPRTTFEMLCFRWAGLRLEYECVKGTASSMDLNYMVSELGDMERKLVSEGMRWV